MEPIKLKHKVDGKIVETDYYLVKSRVDKFRQDHPLWSIITNLEKMENGNVVFSARIADESGRVLSSGWAWEQVNASFINKTSAVENCETSSVGRALALLGYGGDGAYASYDEMQKTIDSDSQDHLFELLRNSTFDDERKVLYEADIKNATLENVSELFDLFSNNQIPAMDRPYAGQKDIQKELDKIDKNPRK